MNSKPKRIIYVDIMRAFAVIMMIQGHTVDTFLAEEYRTMESVGYSIWHTMRGFTAPIFMFTAGMIFTYLLKSDHYEFSKNPRVKKGLKRGLMLIAIGYLLRYPTYRIFDFSYVSQRQWDIFFAVDALHLIGFGMLVILLSLYVGKKLKINLNFVLTFLILILLTVSSFIARVEWNNYLPQILSSYLTRSYGSFFPLFPWLIYVLSGALLGNFLYKNDEIYLKKRFSFIVSLIGLSLVLISSVLFYLESITEGEIKYWMFMNGYIFVRVGYVVLINGLMAFIVRKFNTIPKIIRDTGKKTLMLYVIHIVILYGSAWFPGLYKYYSKSFTPVETIIAVVLMLGLMLSIVQFTEKYKSIKRRKIVLYKV